MLHFFFIINFIFVEFGSGFGCTGNNLTNYSSCEIMIFTVLIEHVIRGLTKPSLV